MPPGCHAATLTVRDARGLEASDTVQILASESPPSATLLAPSPGSFRYGEPIELEGAATDIQDGELGDAALHWRITIHHGQHTHVVEADRTGAETTFTPPGDHDADSSLEFRLTARDSAGLEDTEVVTLQPETIDLRLESSPPGAALGYAGIDVTAPTLRTAAIGFHPTVSAPDVLERDGRRFTFDHWSDGGERLHEIVIPDSGADAHGGLRAGAGAPAAAARPGPRAPAARRRSGAARSRRPQPGSRSTPRQASIRRGGSRGRVTGGSGPLARRPRAAVAAHLQGLPLVAARARPAEHRQAQLRPPRVDEGRRRPLRPLAPRPPRPPATRALRGPDAGEDRVRAPPGRGACAAQGSGSRRTRTPGGA